MPKYEIDITVPEIWSYIYQTEAETEQEALDIYHKDFQPFWISHECIDTLWEDEEVFSIKELRDD